MESILWTLDLIAVVLLCRWAVAEEHKTAPPQKRKG